MTFEAAIEAIKGTFQRTDREDTLPGILNQAVRACADRHSFEEMKKKASATIASGQTETALPSDFKEFQNGRFPVLNAVGSAAAVRTPVYSRSELEMLAPTLRPSLHLVFTHDDGAFTLALPAVASAANVLTLFYFAYPSVVTDLTQSTPLLLSYENLVLAKARALAFQSITDPAQQMYEDIFENELSIVTGKDVRAARPKPREDKE